MVISKNDNYIMEVREENPEISLRITGAATRAYRQTKLTKLGFLDILEAEDPHIGRLVKAKRYQNVFEELMEYGGADESNIIDDETLREELEKALSAGGVRESRRDTMKNDKFNRMLNKLSDRIKRDVPKVRGLIKGAEPSRIEKEEDIPESQRERIRGKLKEGRRLYAFRRKGQRERSIIEEVRYLRKGKEIPAWRDATTGRWAKKPF